MTESPDDRSPLAVAAVWASLATTIALEMALPAMLGHWLDERWNTRPVFVLLGVLVGLTTGLIHLVRLGAKMNRRDNDPPDTRRK